MARGVDAPPPGGRAGTRLDHRFVVKVQGNGQRGRTHHGMIDQRNRVYQTGGRLDHFVYWKQRLLSLDLVAYNAIKSGADVDWVELIDHQRNIVLRTPLRVVRDQGRLYDAGLAPRWGWPLDAALIYNAQWGRLDSISDAPPPPPPEPSALPVPAPRSEEATPSRPKVVRSARPGVEDQQLRWEL